MKEIKDRLAEGLHYARMTPIELARKTGIPKSSISQYMSGYVKPKADRIYLMSRALGVDETWLLGYDVPIVNTHADDETMYKELGFDFFRLPLYAPICCGNGGFADDNIIEYVAIPSRGLSSPENYFCQIAKGDSMTDAGIDDGDLLVFEKTSQIYSGMIGCFCIDENEAMCKKYSVMNGIIILQPMNSKYEPIAVDPTNKCFKCVGVLRKSIKSFNT